jgi:4-hydroxyphenylpyruvate dioxygenase
VQRLRAIGYGGWVSLELMNPVLWQVKTSQLAELGVESVRRLLKTDGICNIPLDESDKLR